MSIPFRLSIVFSLSMCATFVSAQDAANRQLDIQFQAAVAKYDAGQFPEAAAQLEQLLPHAPASFEIQEMLGLAYAAQSQDAKALVHLDLAVRLKPDSAAARTNLAASLAHSGKPALAEKEFQKALALEPSDFEANHDLGEFYVQSGKIAQARPFLEAAQRSDPTSYENGYDLAQVDLLTDRLGDARQLIKGLAQQKNSAELHNLLAQVEEKDGKYLNAANEYEIAAHMEPSEQNLFDWGSELLLHRTYDPAIVVLEQGAARYPNSLRLKIGLGIALYWRGRYDEAVKNLLAATDLNPSDPSCYLFLSEAYGNFPKRADEVVRSFRRYAQLRPDNALAQYYYAMSLWKGKPAEGDTSVDFPLVESLLQKSIALDPSYAEAHFQLGIFYNDQHSYSKSLAEYQRALEIDPKLADVHYRLGQYYVRSGQKDLAQQEFDLYQRLRTERQADLDKQAAEVQQFVFSANGSSSAKP